jgi:putative transposase
MGRLRHRTGPGFTYFITTKCWENRALFQVPENAEILVECMLRYRNQGSFLLHEFVVMPNHLHLMLTPASDTSIEKAMQFIKGGSSHEIHRRRELKLQVWQSGFHEETVRDSNDFWNKTSYIHMNPVRAHLVERPEAWPFGSGSRAFRMDSAPERLSTSAAKAARITAGVMSELKLRPPENLSVSPSGEGDVSPGASGRAAGTPPSGAKALCPPTQTLGPSPEPPAGQSLPARPPELKPRPPEEHNA